MKNSVRLSGVFYVPICSTTILLMLRRTLLRSVILIKREVSTNQ